MRRTRKRGARRGKGGSPRHEISKILSAREETQWLNRLLSVFECFSQARAELPVASWIDSIYKIDHFVVPTRAAWFEISNAALDTVLYSVRKRRSVLPVTSRYEMLRRLLRPRTTTVWGSIYGLRSYCIYSVFSNVCHRKQGRRVRIQKYGARKQEHGTSAATVCGSMDSVRPIAYIQRVPIECLIDVRRDDLGSLLATN